MAKSSRPLSGPPLRRALQGLWARGLRMFWLPGLRRAPIKMSLRVPLWRIQKDVRPLGTIRYRQIPMGVDTKMTTVESICLLAHEMLCGLGIHYFVVKKLRNSPRVFTWDGKFVCAVCGKTEAK